MRRIFHRHNFRCLRLMIINEIKIECVTLIEPKDHSPVSAHSHAPIPLQFPLERMEPPTREQSNFLRARRLVDRQQDIGDFLHQGRRKIPAVPASVKPLQASVPNGVNTHSTLSSPVARQASIPGLCQRQPLASLSAGSYKQISARARTVLISPVPISIVLTGDAFHALSRSAIRSRFPTSATSSTSLSGTIAIASAFLPARNASWIFAATSS